jgi:hypothetical protein
MLGMSVRRRYESVLKKLGGKLGISIVVASVLAVGLAAFVLVKGDPTAAAAASTTSLPTALEQAFPVLQQTPTASDQVPSSLGASLSAAGVDASQSRLALSTPDSSLWIVPGAANTCMVTQTGGGSSYSCTSDAVAESKGLVAGFFTSDPTAAGQEWVGILPSGTQQVIAHDSASAAPISLGAGGGFIQPVTGPKSLTYTTPSGVNVSLSAGLPPAGLASSSPSCSSC